MIAALNRFISRSADRCRHFFLLLNKREGFKWMEECTLAFQQLKKYLSRPPIMSSPEADEVLFACRAVAPHAISLVLIQMDNGIQRLVYYVSKALQEAELRYLFARKGHPSGGSSHMKASPLLPGAHSYRSNAAPA